MEETMSASLDPVTVALAQSDTEGEEFVPADLLAVLSADPNPTAVRYDDIDRSNAHFTPVERDFGFLRILRVRRQAPSPEQQERLVALMRWLRRQFSDWNSTSDSKAHVLAAMFLLTAYLDQGGYFWSSFAAKVTVNAEIVAVLSHGWKACNLRLDLATEAVLPSRTRPLLIDSMPPTMTRTG